MKRFYISPVLGDGNIDAPLPWDATVGDYRTAAAEHQVACVQALPQMDPETGAMLGSWCLVLAISDDQAPLLADPRLHPLPDVSLDIKVSAIGESARAGMISVLAAHGLPSTSMAGADSFRDVITAIGLHLNPAFDINTFDAA